MADKGIIFSAPMVRALLDGRKSQTRRLVNVQRHANPLAGYSSTGRLCNYYGDLRLGLEFVHDECGLWHADDNPTGRSAWYVPIPFAPGDRLYVRESCYLPPKHISARDWREGADTWPKVIYAEDDRDGGRDMMERCCWRSIPSIHMPRWASRLWLNVTDVRVQRLQDISERDAIAEGIVFDDIPDGLIPGGHTNFGFPGYSGFATAVSAYGVLWNTLHTKPGETWAENPFVVAVTFEVNRGNIDAGAA